MDATDCSISIEAVQRLVRKFDRGALNDTELGDGLIFITHAQPQLGEIAMITDATSLISVAESFRDRLTSRFPPAAVVVLLFLGLRWRSTTAASWSTEIQDYLDSIPAAERSAALDTMYSRTRSGLDDEYILRVLPLTAGTCSTEAVDGMRYQLGLKAVRSDDMDAALFHARESTDGLSLIDTLLQETTPGGTEWLTALNELYAYPGKSSEVAVFVAADATAADRPDLTAEITERLGPSADTASNSEASIMSLIHHFAGNRHAAITFAHAAERNDLAVTRGCTEPIASWVLASYESNPDSRLALLQASCYWLVRLGALRARIELDIAQGLIAGDAPRIAALFIGRARTHMGDRSADYSRSERVRYRRIEALLNRFAVTETEVTEVEDLLAGRRLTPIADRDLDPFSRFDEAWHFHPERRYDQSLIRLRS